MKKYMVIDVCEREIGEPEFFNTMLKAQICMTEKFFESCRHISENNYDYEFEINSTKDLDKVMDTLIKEDILDDENNLTENSAWAETANHDNWDCKIIEVEFPTLF